MTFPDTPMILRMTALFLLVATAPPARADKVDSSNKRATSACGRPDADLGFGREPGCSGTVSRAGRTVSMRYNALGLRGKDYPRAAPGGVVRILLTGGSMVTAPGLEENDAPPLAFERALRRGGLRAEVIDGSGEGYTGWQNAVRLKTYLGAYAPKVVIFHLVSHYLFTDRALSGALRVENGEIRGRLSPFRRLPSFPRAFLERRRLLMFALRTYEEQWGRIAASRSIAGKPPAQGLEDLLAPTLSELAQMSAACRASGARFFVLYDGEAATADQYLLIPGPSWPGRLAQALWIRSLRFEGDAVAKRLSEEGAKSGYGVLSLADARAALEDPAAELPGDYHWNERGAKLFGDAAAAAYLAADRRRR